MRKLSSGKWRLIFLGTSAALVTDSHNFQSNLLLQNSEDESLLIDCGSDARRALNQYQLTHRHVNSVYISHLHADHAGGLEWLAFSRKFDDEQVPKPNLYISETFVDNLWEHTLSGGLNSLHDEPASLSAFFQVHAIPEKGSFNWQNIIFSLVKMQHIYSEFSEMPSYGLFFSLNHQKIFLTTDTQFQPEKLKSYYQAADIIFQDCETNEKASGVHAHYQQLKTLDLAIRAKMWLYHYNSNNLPDAQKEGFLGFVKPGQFFEF
jgi:ribonuclease BN (tRNA processing enzyme)